LVQSLYIRPAFCKRETTCYFFELREKKYNVLGRLSVLNVARQCPIVNAARRDRSVLSRRRHVLPALKGHIRLGFPGMTPQSQSPDEGRRQGLGTEPACYNLTGSNFSDNQIEGHK
jgi:hypothetical protein